MEQHIKIRRVKGFGNQLRSLVSTMFDELKATEMARARFAAELPILLKTKSTAVFVAEDADTIVGFAKGDTMRSHPHRLTAQDPYYVYLDQLYIHEDWRGQRIGERLLEAIVDWAGEKDCVGILAHTSGERFSWYEKHGFKISGEILLSL